MFATALIVFRESLEAALFIGIVAAATRGLAGRSRWLAAGVGAGALGAIVLAMLAQHLSAWLDGVGQDVVNIGVLSLAAVLPRPLLPRPRLLNMRTIPITAC